MNLPFNLKFILFDENEELTREQLKLRKSMLNGEILKNILIEAFKNDNSYKFLERLEPSISSIDEKKQFRLRFDVSHSELKQYQHSLHFHQLHSGSKEYFLLGEIKYISHKIKLEIEDYLQYKIDEPIIYIGVNNL